MMESWASMHEDSFGVPSSSASSSLSKGDQMMQQLISKMLNIILDSRVPTSLNGEMKTNKWFNLTLQEKEVWRKEISIWKVGKRDTIKVDVILDISDIPQGYNLMVDSMVSKKATPVPKNSSLFQLKSIILESWIIRIEEEENVSTEELPVFYKKCSAFMRSLFATTRLLPTFKLYRKLRRERSSGLAIVFHISESLLSSPRELPLCESILGEGLYESCKVRKIGSLSTPHGLLSLEVEFRNQVGFEVQDSETMMSTKFLEMEENFFTKNRSSSFKSSKALLESSLKDSKIEEDKELVTSTSISNAAMKKDENIRNSRSASVLQTFKNISISPKVFNNGSQIMNQKIIENITSLHEDDDVNSFIKSCDVKETIEFNEMKGGVGVENLKGLLEEFEQFANLLMAASSSGRIAGGGKPPSLPISSGMRNFQIPNLSTSPDENELSLSKSIKEEADSEIFPFNV